MAESSRRSSAVAILAHAHERASRLDAEILAPVEDFLFDAIEATEERLAFSDPRAPVFVDVGTGDGRLAIQMARGACRSSARAAESSGTL